MTDNDNIFQQGCLVHLESSIWGFKKKIPKDMINVQADPEYVNAVKYLIDPHHMKPIETIRNAARSYLYNKSLPFPIPGLTFVPRDLVGAIDSRLTELQIHFYTEVNTFISHYDTFRESAKSKLNGLFNLIDYPNDISSRFSLQWKYIVLGAPNHTQLLSPEVYEREKQKFEQTMLEFRENAVTVLRTSFMQMVDRIVDRLSGERKVFRDTLISNIQEFLNDFSALNINDDTELSEQVERCRAILKGVNPDVLRSNEAFKEHVAGNMSAVQKDLYAMMKDRPTRKIRPHHATEAA